MADLTSKKQETLLSVILCYKDIETKPLEFLSEIHSFLAENYTDFEVVVVANSEVNGDRFYERVLKKLSSTRLLSLVGEPSEQLQFAAGLENCIGDVIITINPRIDPVNIITLTTRLLNNDTSVVIGRSTYPSSWLYRVIASVFRIFLSKLLDYDAPSGVTHLRGLTRKSLNVLLSKKRYLSQFLYTCSKIGFTTEYLEYEFLVRPKSKKLRVGFLETLSLVVLNSTDLLKYFSLLGLVGSIFALAMSSYAFLSRLLSDNIMEGWASLSVFIAVQFCLLFAILFVFGMYLARLVDELWDFKEYEVLDEKCSSVMFNENRWNVLNDS